MQPEAYPTAVETLRTSSSSTSKVPRHPGTSFLYPVEAFGAHRLLVGYLSSSSSGVVFHKMLRGLVRGHARGLSLLGARAPATSSLRYNHVGRRSSPAAVLGRRSALQQRRYESGAPAAADVPKAATAVSCVWAALKYTESSTLCQGQRVYAPSIHYIFGWCIDCRT